MSATSATTRLVPLGKVVDLALVFLLGQGSLQAINVSTALFLLRTMSVDSYAQYSVALAFQTAAIALTSLGLTDSIVPLVGPRVDDRQLVGRYVTAAQHLRTRLLLPVAPLCAIVFLIIGHRHGWPVRSQSLLLASVFLSLLWSVSVSSYTAPLILHRNLASFYTAQNAAGLARLAVCALANCFVAISSGFAAMTGALGIWLGGFLTKRSALRLIEVPSRSDPATTSEVWRCMLPMMPSAIVSAFQPQLTLFLVSLSGQTAEIAEIAALMRITQIFLIVSTFSKYVIEPYVAKLPAERVAATCARIITAATLLAVPVTAFAFLLPAPIGAILGSKYSQLAPVIGWVIANCCFNMIANMLWVMNRARRWLFWRGSILEITCLVLFQGIYAVSIGVDTTKKAALFMLMASAANFVAHAYIMAYGLYRERRRGRHA
jgi:O-antigen/teichoic acid export membrane protein